MTDTPEITPLPDAQAYLKGGYTIKPLQHDAAALRTFAKGFEEIPLKPPAAERLVKLGEIMRLPEWESAHNAARQALYAARRMVTENPASDLEAQAHIVNSIFKSQAVNSNTLNMVTHPDLQTAFVPVRAYLEKFGHVVTDWAMLTPSLMLPKKDEERLTPVAHRAKIAAETPATYGTAHPCGDPGCTVDHAPPTQQTPDIETPHTHGPDCGHEHPSHPSGGGCSHGKPPEPKRFGRGGLLAAAGIVGAVCAGAYLLHTRSQKPEKKNAESWTERTEASAEPEARTL